MLDRDVIGWEGAISESGRRILLEAEREGAAAAGE